jgi:hypothetical protein
MVVRTLGGELLKGFSHDFAPNKPHFHLQLIGPTGEGIGGRDVYLKDVGAIFFVRDFAFDREDHLPGPLTDENPVAVPAGARAVVVKFIWGEEMEGLTYGYDPRRPGFFVYPTAPPHHAYNCERAYISRDATETVTMR